MKILTVSNCPLVESQGSGYVITNFCRRLRERGHQVDAFGPETHEPLPFLKGRAKSHRLTLGMLSITLRQLRRCKYDLVEFYGGEAWLAVQQLSQRPHRAFVMVSHSNGIELHGAEKLIAALGSVSLDASPKRWYQFGWAATEKAFTNVDGLVTVSQYDAEYAVQHGYQQAERIVPIENALPEEFHHLPVSFVRKPVLGYCGSWLARKGTAAIRADISRLLTEYPQWSFRMIGVGQNFRKEEHFTPGVCERIDVIPFVQDKHELQKQYQNLSILIMPSIYESFGLVAAEAMACGCALVASRTGFAYSLKDREEAVLMQEPCSPHLYNSLKMLIEDNGLRKRVAQGGYTRVQSLKWKNAVDELETAYMMWFSEFKSKV